MQNAREVRELFAKMASEVSGSTKDSGIVWNTFDFLNSANPPRRIVETVVKQSICSPGGEFLIGIDQLDESSAHLIPLIVLATSRAFPELKDEMPGMVRKVYYDHLTPQTTRTRQLARDAQLICGLFLVYESIWGDAQQALFIQKYCDLLKLGLTVRWWKESPVTPGAKAMISSGMKKLFATRDAYVNNSIKDLLRSLRIMVSDAGVFFAPADRGHLEMVLCDEISFKAFNRHLVEDRIRLLMPLPL